jgi:hypothetical protein
VGLALGFFGELADEGFEELGVAVAFAAFGVESAGGPADHFV